MVLAITPGTGTADAVLNCPTNGDPASAGRTTLSCSIGTGGAGPTLTATSTGLASGVSSPFNIGPVYTLTVSKQGTGSGTVQSTPAGISCGATCSQAFCERRVGHRHAGRRDRVDVRRLERSLRRSRVLSRGDERCGARSRHVQQEHRGQAILHAQAGIGEDKRHAEADRPLQGAASIRLTGTITARKKKSKHSVSPSSAPLSGHAVAGKPLTLTVKLPKAALSALEAGAKESAAFKLTATNSGGSATATASIKHLTLAKAKKKRT